MTLDFEYALQIPDVDDSGQYLYLPTSGNGIRILDISNPLVAFETSSYEGARNASEVVVRGDRAYVDDTSEDKVVILDISDPLSPVEISTYWFEFEFPFFGFDVTDDLWLLTGWYHSMRVLDISDEYSVQEVGSYEDIEGTLYFLDVSDGNATILNSKRGQDGLLTLDISNFSDITKTGSLETEHNNFYAMDVSEGYAYVPARYDGLKVFDVSDPANPSGVGTCEEIGDTRDVVVSGSFAYVADFDGGLRIIDISTPTNPTLISTQWIPGRALFLALSGNYAYVSAYYDWHGLRIIDISDPYNPWEVGSLEFEDGGRVRRVAVQGDHVFLTHNRKACKVINVSDPENPFEVTSFETYYPTNLSLSGHLLFVSDWLYGLRVWDVSNPASPVQVEVIREIFLPEQTVVKENYIYVLNRDSGLYVFEIKR
jgi:hypothetical protein